MINTDPTYRDKGKDLWVSWGMRQDPVGDKQYYDDELWAGGKGEPQVWVSRVNVKGRSPTEQTLLGML